MSKPTALISLSEGIITLDDCLAKGGVMREFIGGLFACGGTGVANDLDIG